IPLLGIHTRETRSERNTCIPVFIQVKGNFARLKACISELRMLQREGCFRPQGISLQLAIEDGLQQFKQYSRHVSTGAALTYSSLEELGSHVAWAKKKTKEDWMAGNIVNSLSQESPILATDIDLQTIDSDIVSMEIFFKAWLHNSGTDQEHVHLLLPSRSISNISRTRDDSMCLKCDLQERLLSPSLLPGTADGSLRMDDPKGDFSTLYQMVSQSSASCYKLRVINLRFCMSLFQKREWLLLAKGEPLNREDKLREPTSTFYVILPSPSPTLLVKAVATRELMLPSPFPLLPEDMSADSLKTVESILDDLELESTYNPLQVWSHLYSHLSSTFANPHGRFHPSSKSRAVRKAEPLQINRVRATVAPLPMTPAPGRASKMPAASKASSEVFFQPSMEEEEEEADEEYPSGP
ncbi:hypothetical protein FD755_007910, partial [Muntiacus reevesi]